MTSKYITDYEFTDPSVEGDFSRDHVDNDEWSDRPLATRWFILPQPGRSLWVKVKRDVFGLIYISEVVRPLNIHHLPAYKYAVLPGSYKPYALSQWYAIVPEGSAGFHLTDDTQLWFFGLDSVMPGVELRDDKSDVVSPIPALKRCKLNEALDDGFELGDKHVKEDEFREVYFICGAPSVGKSTLVKAMNLANVPAIDGDTFGSARRKARNDVDRYRRWMLSEMDELKAANAMVDQTEVDDAILDAFGIACLGLATLQDPEAGYAKFIAEQQKRGRPRRFWYDLIETYLHVVDESEARLAVNELLHDRYNDSNTEQPYVWDMDWMIDVEQVIASLTSGTSVAVTGTNVDQILKRISETKFPDDLRVNLVYLTCPFWVIRGRLKMRADRMKEETGTRYPFGIHDIDWESVMSEELDRQQLFHSYGATFVHDRGGRYKWADVRNSVHLS